MEVELHVARFVFREERKAGIVRSIRFRGMLRFAFKDDERTRLRRVVQPHLSPGFGSVRKRKEFFGGYAMRNHFKVRKLKRRIVLANGSQRTLDFSPAVFREDDVTGKAAQPLHYFWRDGPGFDRRIKNNPRFGGRLSQMLEILHLKYDVVEQENDRRLELVRSRRSGETERFRLSGGYSFRDNRAVPIEPDRKLMQLIVFMQRLEDVGCRRETGRRDRVPMIRIFGLAGTRALIRWGG